MCQHLAKMSIPLGRNKGESSIPCSSIISHFHPGSISKPHSPDMTDRHSPPSNSIFSSSTFLFSWIVSSLPSSSVDRNGNRVMGNHLVACQVATSGVGNPSSFFTPLSATSCDIVSLWVKYPRNTPFGTTNKMCNPHM